MNEGLNIILVMLICITYTMCLNSFVFLLTN